MTKTNCQCYVEDNWVDSKCDCPIVVKAKDLLSQGYNKKQAMYLSISIKMGY